MKIVCTLEARMGSTRLPGKMMAELVDGKSTIEVMIERLQRTRYPDEIVLATTTESQDDVLVAEAERLGVEHYRGSEDDVMKRVYEAGEAYDADVVCEICGDCPLHDPAVIDQIVACYQDNPSFDYVSNMLVDRWPLGLLVEIISMETLDHLTESITEESHREHVTTYIRSNPEKFDVFNVSPPPTLRDPDLRLTLDYEEDLKLIREILSRIYDGGDFDLYDIVGLVEANPELREINKQYMT